MSLNVLADDGFFMVASNVVPFNAISIKVVKDGQTGLRVASLLCLLSVVGLSLLGSAGE